MRVSSAKVREKRMAANSELSGKDVPEWLEDSEPGEDEELDPLRIAASVGYESSQSPPPASASAPAQMSSSHTRFVPPTTEKEIQRARENPTKNKARYKSFARMCGKRGERREKKLQNRKYHH